MTAQRQMQTAGASAGGGSVAVQPAPSDPWILGRYYDLVLFVGTPLLIIPLFFALRTKLSVETIALYVAAFGATGHHLPGMMRAYGDKALFQRFKTRFIVAPVFLATVCVLFTMYELSAVILAVYLWGAWHGLAQIYGFVRIYDAKKRSFAEVTKRLDFLMCISWILCGMVWSPTRVYFLVDLWHVKCGAPMPPAALIPTIQISVAVFTGIVTLLFAANHIRLMRSGQSPSWIKILLLGTSFGFWWWANFSFSNMLVGVAMFEIFHDVQYLSIVWIFNKKRAEKDPNAGSFTRFLFRRSGVLIGLYVGLVFAYGSMQLVSRGIHQETIQNALVGLLAASALLHFYYDGFIWKVREKKTAEALGVSGDRDENEDKFGMPPWLKHGMKWSLFIVPLFVLGFLEPDRRADSFERLQGLAELLPKNSQVHHELGIAYSEKAAEFAVKFTPTDKRVVNTQKRAEEHFVRSIENGSDLASPHHNLGEIYLARGETDKASASFEKALVADPKFAGSLANLGLIAMRENKLDEATRQLQKAVRIDPQLSAAWNNLARVYTQQQRYDEALGALEESTMSDPENAATYALIASTYQYKNMPEEAIAAYDEALDRNPEFVQALLNRGRLHSVRGNHDAAIEDLRTAARLNPRQPVLRIQLAEAMLKADRRAEALEQFKKVLIIDSNNETALRRISELSSSAPETP